MGLRNIADVNDAYNDGRYRIYSFRKAPTQTTASGIWFDLSMSPGNPVPNYYAASPMVSKALAQSTDGGIFHGANVSPATKHLHKLTAYTVTTTAVPLPVILCDYLLYYPFIDMSVTDPQAMTVGDALPRYTTDKGLQMMAVEVAAQIGGVSFFVNYTNQDGVTGRTSATVTCNTQVTTGTIISTAPASVGCAGPFIPLQAGDTGVTAIESVTFLSGDVGLITLVIVKPLATHQIYDITAPAEKDFLVNTQSAPKIEDNAYLNLIAYPSGTLASSAIFGFIETIFTE